MELRFKLIVVISLICVAKAYFPQYPELFRMFPPQNAPEGYEEYLKERQENPDFLKDDGTPGNTYKALKELKEEIMSFRIEDGIPEEYKYNFTAECYRDYQRWVEIFTNPIYVPLWASRMWDATGFWEQGILDGNFLFEGRYDECIRAKEPPNDRTKDPIQGMHCLTYWLQQLPVLGQQKRGHGVCLPDTCTDDDAEAFIRTVLLPNLPRLLWINVHCERGVPDLSEDPEAIISIIILCLFGILVLISTIYHYFVVETEDESSQSTTQNPGSVAPVTREEENMETYLTPQPRQAEPSEPEPDYASDTETENHNSNVPNGEIKTLESPPSYEASMAKTSGHRNRPNGEATTPKVTHRSTGKYNNGFVSDSNGTVLELQNMAEPAEMTAKNTRQRKSMNELSMAEQFLLSFSLYITVPLITTTKQPKGAYGCLNGLRVLAMVAVILGHTYALGTLEWPPTVENEFKLYSRYGYPAYYKMFTMDVYVDTFLILSAFLVATSFLRKLKKTNGNLGVTGWIMHYFGRYWRLTPTYFIILMIYSNFWHYFRTGPFMKQYVVDADSCEDSWWTNLLYINNLYLDSGWCFGWSWYLCVDWQLYCIAPLFLYIIWRWEIAGIVLNLAGVAAGIISTAVLKHELYTQDPDAEDPVDDFVDIYIKPWCRCHVYFMGILLGYLFYKTEGKIKMPWWVVALGWFVAVSMYGIVSYMPAITACQTSDVCGPWTPAENTAYYTLNRIMWGLWVCWVILACSTGYGGFVNTFLSWKFFVPLGKLTYLGYLIHPIFTFLYFYGSPIQQYYYDYFFMYLFAANLLIVHVLSFFLATAVSAPLMGSIAVFLPSMRRKERR